MFNAFGEGYLRLFKMFLFLSIHRLYFIEFLHEIDRKSVKIFLGFFFWVPILFKWYQSTSGCGTVQIKKEECMQ